MMTASLSSKSSPDPDRLEYGATNISPKISSAGVLKSFMALQPADSTPTTPSAVWLFELPSNLTLAY